MTLVYVYQADLLCEDCGKARRDSIASAGDSPADVDDESSYDSDDFPKGPTEEGESDTPSYCSDCGTFLESDLTKEGETYVREASGACAQQWRAFYSYLFVDGDG